MKGFIRNFSSLSQRLLFRPHQGDSGFSVLIKSNDSYFVDRRYGNRSLVRLIILSDCANASFSMTASFVMSLLCHIILHRICSHLVVEFGTINGLSVSCLYSILSKKIIIKYSVIPRGGNPIKCLNVYDIIYQDADI